MKKLISTILAIVAIFSMASYVYASAAAFQVNTASGGTLTTSQIAYYNMQGNSNDYLGVFNGSDTSVTYATSTGKVNQGGAYNGSAFSSIANSASLSPSVLSIAMWVNFASINASVPNSVLQKRDQINGSGGWGMFYCSGTNCGQTSGGMTFATTGNANFAWSPSTGTWYFIVLTSNSGSDKFYVNGTQTGGTQTGTAITNFAAPMYFGYGGTKPDWTFTGDEDEIGLWNKILSANEITDLYNAGAGQTMCNGTGGGPACGGGSTPRRKVILISFEAIPKDKITITA